jgi:hypothetical protein
MKLRRCVNGYGSEHTKSGAVGVGYCDPPLAPAKCTDFSHRVCEIYILRALRSILDSFHNYFILM